VKFFRVTTSAAPAFIHRTNASSVWLVERTTQGVLGEFVRAVRMIVATSTLGNAPSAMTSSGGVVRNAFRN
jgi:hypothetical protein